MPMDKRDCAFSPLRWINNVSSTTCFSLMSYANNKAKARHPAGHIQTGGTMSEMRYAYTNFLIVTCYLLPQGRNDVVPSLWLRYAFASGSLPSMEHQRTYNGFTTEVERNCIGRVTRAFFASLHRFLCGVNEFSMMSTKSGLCKPFQENDNLSSIMSTNAV